MKHIIVGTNRKNSASKKVALYVQRLYEEKNEQVQLMDIADLELELIGAGEHLGKAQPLPPKIKKAIDDLTSSEGLIFVVPEYNGGIPGALKTFIDHWNFPATFVSRPVCYVGVSTGVWGALRPIEHLSQVMAYRNSYQYPVRVYIREVHKCFNEGYPVDPMVEKLLRQQVEEFPKFCRALHAEGLDANALLARS